MNRGAVATLFGAGAIVTLTIGCSTTVDETLGTTPVDNNSSVETNVTTTTLIEGSATDLLLEMVTEMSRLGSVVAENGDDVAIIERIEALWAVAQIEVRATRAELLGGMETTVEMARRSVETTRPADADKAFGLLSDLVDDYTGEG